MVNTTPEQKLEILCEIGKIDGFEAHVQCIRQGYLLKVKKCDRVFSIELTHQQLFDISMSGLINLIDRVYQSRKNYIYNKGEN